MRLRSDFENYNTAVSLYLNRELPKLEKSLQKNILTQNEKRLIKARLSNLKGESKEAIGHLDKVITNEPYLNLHKNLVFGLIHSRQSNFQLSAYHNCEALHYAKVVNDKSAKFSSSYNLANDYLRLGLNELFLIQIQKTLEYATNFSQSASILRAQASFYSRQGEHQKALEECLKITNSTEFNNLKEKNQVINLKADIIARTGDTEKAYLLINALAQEKKYKNRPRAIFEKTALEFIIGRKVKIKKRSHLIEQTSEYGLLWETLFELQNGEPEKALYFWDKLKLKNPDKYLDYFTYAYKGDQTCIFMQALTKIKQKNSSLDLSVIKPGTKKYLLLKALKESETPLRKEVLIEKIWNVSYSPDYDNRFYKLIERVKKALKIDIHMQNSTYFL